MSEGTPFQQAMDGMNRALTAWLDANGLHVSGELRGVLSSKAHPCHSVGFSVELGAGLPMGWRERDAASPGQWTGDPPTSPGFYFVRNGWGEFPVKVYEDGGHLCFAGPHVSGGVGGTKGQWKWWSEPIAAPEPPVPPVPTVASLGLAFGDVVRWNGTNYLVGAVQELALWLVPASGTSKGVNLADPIPEGFHRVNT